MPPRQPSEALLALNELIDEEGNLPLQAALEIFAAQVAPLPGVTPQTLPGESADRVAEASVQVILRNRAALAPDVAAAIDQALFGAIEEEFEVPPSTSGSSPSRLWSRLPQFLVPSTAAQTPREALREEATALRQRIEERSGLRLRLRLSIAIARLPRLQGVADTPVGSDGRPQSCRIVIDRAVVGDPALREFVLLHELWHCFQFDRAPHMTRSWLLEGQAEWVAAALASDPSPAAENWATWLGTPHLSLWRRSYDAVGLYATAAEAGHDPFPVLIEMGGLGNEAALSRLFGGMPPTEALQLVAMSVVRTPEFGDEWEIVGPGIAPNRATTPFPVTLPAQEASIDAGAFGSLPLELRVSRGSYQFLELRAGGPAASGAVEFSDVGPVPLIPGSPLLFCLVEGECVCPDGSGPGGDAPLLRGSAPRGVATVATPHGGTIRLEARLLRLEDLCNPLVGTWIATMEDILAANTAPYGRVSARELGCEGLLTMTFAADGALTRMLEATCRRPDGLVASFSGRQVGTYEVNGDRLIVRGVDTTITGNARGMEFVAANVLGQGGAATFTVEGDELRLQFAMPDGQMVEQRWQRQR